MQNVLLWQAFPYLFVSLCGKFSVQCTYITHICKNGVGDQFFSFYIQNKTPTPIFSYRAFRYISNIKCIKQWFRFNSFPPFPFLPILEFSNAILGNYSESWFLPEPSTNGLFQAHKAFLLRHNDPPPQPPYSHPPGEEGRKRGK